MPVTLPSATFPARLTFGGAGLSRVRPVAASVAAALALHAKVLGRDSTLGPASFRGVLHIAPALDTGRPGLGAGDIINEIALMWGLRGACELQEHDRRRALHDLNRAMQVLWNRAPDRKYWTQGSLRLVFTAGVGVLNLENEIQNIVGEAALENGRALVPVGTITEIEQSEALFLDSAVPDHPVFYYIERMNQAAHDAARCRFHVAPTPVADAAVIVDAVFEPPRFGVNDIARNTLVPIPHRYAESLLLPVVRYYAAQYWQNQLSEQQRQTVEGDYREVAVVLGLADPLPGLSGDNRPRREEAVA
jgi:hypothetical protein